MFDLDSYDYFLPERLVAAYPALRREASRLLVLDRATDGLRHESFGSLPELLGPEDVLVVNDTRVFPARLRGRKPSGGRVEFLLLSPPNGGAEWQGECLVKGRPRLGDTVTLGGGLRAETLDYLGPGRALVRFSSQRPFADVLAEVGETPLPPYIRRPAEAADLGRYQTVYAERLGAVAAPTAGLHFSADLLETLVRRGVEILKLTLHVGHGTFLPLRCQDIRDHAIHAETAEVSEAVARRVTEAKAEGKRIVAVGTTTTRVLEWAAEGGCVSARRGECGLYIYPGHEFRVVDRLITNFHLPKSSLLLLVSAFAGREAVLRAYHEAVAEGYRFYSYGDAMLII
ncbi:MAG: tRNA preQ1(34) S-adenosylmethionine ribosyltransferase-isomerase QueA [Pseudomonadota bacterium]